MASRRSFIRDVSLMTMMTAFSESIHGIHDKMGSEYGINWEGIRSLFPIITWDKIHMNSGSAGVMPIPVQENLLELIRYINTKAPYVVWGEWQEIKKKTLSRLAALTGSTSDELQIVRNTTEALNMIIYGLRTNPGDEIILADHDYPFARNAWKNRAERDGLSLKEVDLILPASDDDVVAAYKSLITPKTRVIHITHMTHREGHIMPVKRLTKMAHQADIEVVVDGAHVVGQIPVNLHDLGCDYFASSLHKWLNAPLGTGLLFVKKDKIEKLYNHPSSNIDARGSMDKFEHIGTRAWVNEIGIAGALDFHDIIGQVEKTERLQLLKEYWMDHVQQIDRVQFHTYKDKAHSGAVSTFSIDDMPAGKIRNALNERYDIHAKSVGGKWGSGIRISPNIFTNFKDLDRLIKAITELSKMT